jgi:hypothetical protein
MVYCIFDIEFELCFVNSAYLGCLRQCSPAASNSANTAASLTMPGLSAVDDDSRECPFASLTLLITLAVESSFNEILSSGGSVSIIAAFELPSTFPHILMQCNIYDLPKDPFTLLKVDEFDPKVASGSDALFLLHLDDPQEGLSEAQFLRLLAKCGACKNILTKRSIPHHECPPHTCMKDALQSPAPAPAGVASQLLDAFMPGGEFGISVQVFQENFVRCMDCHQFLTRRASSLHNCKLEQEFRDLAATYSLKLL